MKLKKNFFNKIYKRYNLSTFYSQVDVKIIQKVISKNILKTLRVAPFSFILKLEVDNTGRIVRLIKWIKLVEILKEQGVNLHLKIERFKVDQHQIGWRWFRRWNRLKELKE